MRETKTRAFLLKPYFFQRVMKGTRDHECCFCKTAIPTGSSFHASFQKDELYNQDRRCCEQCFDRRIKKAHTIHGRLSRAH